MSEEPLPEMTEEEKKQERQLARSIQRLKEFVPPPPPEPVIKVTKINKRKPQPRASRFGMDAKGKAKYDDIRNLPPLEIDDNGFAIRPREVGDSRRRKFNIEERKVRFLLMWNYSGGIKTLACQEAGITRKIADEWLKDPEFLKLVESAKEEIADRIKLRFAQSIGLLPMPENIKINPGSLSSVARAYCPEMFGDISEPGEPNAGNTAQTETNVPRPERPA